MVENGVVSNGGQRAHVVAARVMRGEGAAAGVLRVALGTLALCASARVEVPLTPVPFTLQVLALCLVVLAMRPREAVSSAASYVLVGSLGAPVFSGGMGGVARIAGPTGGFILGFVAAAAVGTLVLRGASRLRVPYVVRAMLALATTIAVVYTCGWAQLMVVAHLAPAAAFAAGVAPFVALDLMKAGIATSLAAAGRMARGGDAVRA
ncbi:MAG: biotin transporter BioY [Olsenella umbonata]|nr:biotin transporter BioY [Parafannyhessea umbonata]